MTMTQAIEHGREQNAEARQSERARPGRVFRPNADIFENDNELLVVADMPGINPDQIEIRFEAGTLEIHGRTRPRPGDGIRQLRREYGIGDFYRAFAVSEVIDGGRISAEYCDGVLALHLPKTEAAKPRRIEVKGVG